MLNRSKEEIARDLVAQATRTWGTDRVDALRGQIEETADWLSAVGSHRLEIDGDEPDFLVDPAAGREAQ